MMMPANYSAIAEEEMTYVVGGAFSLGTVGANAVTIVGNSFVGKLINATLGVMFSGVWGVEGGSHMGDSFKALYQTSAGADQNWFNKIMTTVGLGAAVYQLGTSTTKKFANEKKFIYNINNINN